MEASSSGADGSVTLPVIQNPGAFVVPGFAVSLQRKRPECTRSPSI